MNWRWVKGAGMAVSSLLGRRAGSGPALEGRRTVPGLGGARVDIVRDGSGVPHIRADSMRDAVFGLGYVHAQDRLWQLELRRRVGMGNLAALLGDGALPVDRYVRRIGIPDAARREWAFLEEEPSLGERLLRSYSLGINAYILETQQGSQPLPLELRLLGGSPAPWRPHHSLAWLKMVSYGLSYGWQAALVRWLLLKELGPLAASEVDPGPGLTSALLNDTPLGPARPVSVWQEAATLLDLNGGSNAWVIAPERTAGGAAQLAGDPHLPLEWPCFWYVARLQAPLSEAEQALWVALMEKALASGGKAPAILPWEPPERLDAAGGTIPAIPVVLAGRNQQVAWSPTAAMTDVQDLFIERLEGWPEPRYRTENGWEDARIEYHEIEVRGREPAPSSTVITRNGPLVARLGRDGSVHMWDEAGTPPLGSWRGLAMRWLGTDNSLSPPVDAVGMAACLQLAVSPGEVQAVTGAWRDPCKRVAFACRSGEVGVAMAGQLPHRRRGDGGLPYPGWQAASRWAGVLRLADAELPEESQNADGIVVAANETVPGVAGNYHPAFRARRIQHVLDGLEEITVAHHARLQVDRESGLGLRFVARLRERPPGTSGPTERRALGELMTWDGRLESNAPGAAVFQFVFHELLSLLSQERLGPQLAAYYLGKGFSPISRSTTWRTRAPAAILKLWLPEGRRWYWQDRLERAFRSGVERLVAAQGERPENWRWGDVRTVEPFHVMARENPWLRRLFDVPSVKLEGGIDTVAPGGFSYHRFPEGTGSLGVYRQVIDWAQPDRFWFALAGGQGAHPGSPHHVDLLPAWQEGRLTPLWMGQDPAPEEFGPHRTLVLERD